MKVIHRKPVIFLRSVPEYRNDLSRRKLEQQKRNKRQTKTAGDREKISGSHPLLFLRTVIETGDRLQPLRNTDDKR